MNRPGEVGRDAEFTKRIMIHPVSYDNPETPAKYGVRGIPTLLLVRQGQVVATQVGAMTLGQLKEWIGQHLA